MVRCEPRVQSLTVTSLPGVYPTTHDSGQRRGAGFRIGDPAPEPPPPLSEHELISSWSGDYPVVSIVCATYGHVEFIRTALHGFLCQRTEFPFEILVRDDGSLDGTADVVAEFAARYPRVVRATLEPENTRGTASAHGSLVERAKGRYIAHCDGDDYWLDPTKLATQVRALEANPWAVLAHHQSLVVADGRVRKTGKLKADARRDLTQRELRNGARVLGNTIVYRNVPVAMPPRREGMRNGDLLRRVLLAEHGGAVYCPDLLPAVYREHPGGMWSTLDDRSRRATGSQSLYWIGVHLHDLGDEEAALAFLERSADMVATALLPEGGPDARPGLVRRWLPDLRRDGWWRRWR